MIDDLLEQKLAALEQSTLDEVARVQMSSLHQERVLRLSAELTKKHLPELYAYLKDEASEVKAYELVKGMVHGLMAAKSYPLLVDPVDVDRMQHNPLITLGYFSMQGRELCPTQKGKEIMQCVAYPK